ncbi:MAG: alpha-glucan family phosphorylase [Desulfobulbaceae bacterium]|uniref:glycogen phosphorylase n=1 Tax=Candidatus Desulfatifera sulfidica TaxID=2841691 RepID=A0A8J6N9V7_9BACT|nr:alpha-glucan family phosphorylase [Candidatus Desulfatifera sulfidica]
MNYPKNIDPMELVSRNAYGTYFGVSQDVFDKVWSQLTHEDGNSVAYISMEIGADPDVYNPVKDRLDDLSAAGATNPQLLEFINKLNKGPGKIPHYSGGLGVLAGDTLKSFADCRIPVVAISLFYRHGYFSQYVDSQLGQISQQVTWQPEKTHGLYLLKDPNKPEKPLTIDVPFVNEHNQDSIAQAQVWMKMEISQQLDFFVPEFLLDFHLPGTPELLKKATRQLYNAESTIIKAVQRRMLGTGIIPLLDALGLTAQTLHLNEQHGVIVVLQLISQALRQELNGEPLTSATDQQILTAADRVAQHVVYTIHTPVKAGHDRFDKGLYAGISRASCQHLLNLLARDDDNPHTYNFTTLAMQVNRTTNSVSRLHRDVTRKQFPQFSHKIDAITNGVHHTTWISNNRTRVFDNFEELRNWRQAPEVFSRAEHIKDQPRFRNQLHQAWKDDTARLYNLVNHMLFEHRNQHHETWIEPPNYYSSLIDKQNQLTPETFTIGFARRFSTYKRADLIFEDIDTLCEILTENNWPVNFLFAGKAHPADEPGKTLIKLILDCQEELYRKSRGLANLIFIPNYDMKLAKIMVAGVHAWLNSPKRPLEASGTSGMKAAMNGVPNISIMDGWWMEGYHNGATGWKFGQEGSVDESCLSENPKTLLYKEDSTAFYQLLPEILESFYTKPAPEIFIDKAVMNLALNGPIFNTHRMVTEYIERYQLILPEEQVKIMHGHGSSYNSNQE